MCLLLTPFSPDQVEREPKDTGDKSTDFSQKQLLKAKLVNLKCLLVPGYQLLPSPFTVPGAGGWEEKV